MVKVLGSRRWSFVGIGIVILLLIGLVAYGAHYFFKIDTTRNQSIFMEGEYSVDDGAVTILDATCIQRRLSSLSVSVFIRERADADLDRTLTILDATYIQRWLAELPSDERIGKPLS